MDKHALELNKKAAIYGMKTSKSGSSQFASRRYDPPSPASKRRKGEHSDWDDEPPSKYSDESECSDDELPRRECQYNQYIHDERARLRGDREARRLSAWRFSSLDSTVSRYCIEPGACSRWSEKSFNITWVGVHGIDSICVVTRNQDLVRLVQEVRPPKSGYFRGKFWNTIISNVEDIAGLSGESCPMCNTRSKKPFCIGPSGEPCQMLHMSRKKPFGVVSVIPGKNKAHKASSAEYDVAKALKLLMEEMDSVTAFTFDKTTQTAISAFQHLFCQNFGADELRVFVLKNDEYVARELKQKRESRLGIDEVLSFINGPSWDYCTV